MLPSRKWRLLASLLAFISVVPHLSAVVVEGRLYHGVVVSCVHSGAWIGQRNMGVYSRARLYEEQVFTGTVQSEVEISFTDKRLQIVPDETFLGDAAGEITATVNQACLPENLPEIKAGDKWLFFLRTKKYLHPDANPAYITTDGLMVDFESPAKPASLAEYDICLLRLHSDIDESCIALMPARPRESSPSCRLKVTPFPFTNPFPRPFQEDGTKLAHIFPPPEFRTYQTKGLNASGVILQTRGWLFSCSPDDD